MLINRSSLWVSVALVAPCFAASGSFPLVMVANHGQAGASARFLAKGPRMSVHFEPAAAVVRLGGAELRIEYPGATGPDQILPEAAASGVANFLIGPADTWVLDEPLLSGIRYSNLYGHIDLSYRASGANLKSEFLVPAGEDPGRIRLRYRGATQITVAPDGALMIQVGRHTLRESPPVLYQEHGGSRSAVAGGYRVDGDMVSFSVAPYDTMAPLVVDPVLSYVTLIGGAGADAATAMAIDSSGAAYLAGFTASYDLPVTTPEQSANAGGNEAFVAKLNATGNALVFCTYIGGRGDDRAYGIAVDSSGSAYVAGSTTSTNFPVKSALQSKLAGGRNAFVLKLTPAGNALVFSTYLGGSGLDSATAIALDSARNAYIGGNTTSLNFPAGAMQTVNRGASDGFVAKLPADGSRLIFATYLGGSGDDHISTIGVDSAGSAVVAGSTYSPDFPIANARQPQLGGGQDAFIAKLAADGKSLVFSTYFGGSGGMMGAPEAAYGVAVDGAGNIYVAGETGSTNFPVRTPAQSSNAGWQDAFAAKWTPTGSLVYSTYIGG